MNIQMDEVNELFTKCFQPEVLDKLPINVQLILKTYIEYMELIDSNREHSLSDTTSLIRDVNEGSIEEKDIKHAVRQIQDTLESPEYAIMFLFTSLSTVLIKQQEQLALQSKQISSLQSLMANVLDK